MDSIVIWDKKVLKIVYRETDENLFTNDIGISTLFTVDILDKHDPFKSGTNKQK